jgi:hypothetical protein
MTLNIVRTTQPKTLLYKLGKLGNKKQIKWKRAKEFGVSPSQLFAEYL